MLLDKWMTENGISDAAFAGMIGKTRADVFRYRKGWVIPRPTTMERITKATSGAVRIGDCYAGYDPPPKRKLAKS